jgi:hypothetical protein
MAEVTNEPIYEALKAVQARLGNVEDSMREVRGEVRALRSTVGAIDSRMSAFRMDLGNLYETSSAMEGRLSRIERRLEITDTPHV